MWWPLNFQAWPLTFGISATHSRHASTSALAHRPSLRHRLETHQVYLLLLRSAVAFDHCCSFADIIYTSSVVSPILPAAKRATGHSRSKLKPLNRSNEYPANFSPHKHALEATFTRQIDWDLRKISCKHPHCSLDLDLHNSSAVRPLFSSSALVSCFTVLLWTYYVCSFVCYSARVHAFVLCM